MNDASSASRPLSVPQTGTLSISADAIEWRDSDTEGFLYKPLVEDAASGQRTWLMKIEAGASSPLHAHTETEQIFVLEGSFHDRDRHYRPGDYLVRAPGTEHKATSDEGALVLVIFSPA